MVPKHLRKCSESLDQESLMASVIELQGRMKNDKSVLRQPIDTGVRGVRDLMKAVVGGTQELQELLLNECTIIYECKICRNLFRSLANFISHKRIYCIKSYTYFTEASTKQEKELFDQSNVSSEPEIVKCDKDVNLSEPQVWLTSDTIVPNNIKTEKNNCLKPTRRIKISPLKITRKCDIAKIADGLSQKARNGNLKPSEDVPGPIFYSDIAERVMMRRSRQLRSSPQLDNLSNNFTNKFFPTSREAVNGYLCDSMQMEVIDRVARGNEAILQENGKFRVTPQGMQIEDNENLEKYKCSLCETHFITQQTLTRHVQIHHKERICYPCPVCRTYFPSPSSTYRHLSKDHHKTEQQIRRLRPRVLAKAIKRKLVDVNPKIEEDKSRRLKEEGGGGGGDTDGVLRCANCGKLFNRQAVLRVHLPSCKRREGGEKESQNPKPTSQGGAKRSSASDLRTVKVPQQKSGILVRRDYTKKLNCTNTFPPCPSGKPVKANHSCKSHSVNRVNKWRTILQKLQSRSGIDVNEKAQVIPDSK